MDKSLSVSSLSDESRSPASKVAKSVVGSGRLCAYVCSTNISTI